MSSKNTIWTTNFSSPISNSPEAALLDDGNFVLRNSLETSTIYWQSFDHPTDIILPGGKIGTNKTSGQTTFLTSWENWEEPTPGKYSLRVDPNQELILEWDMSISYWKGKKFSSLNNIYNFSFVTNGSERYFTYIPYNMSTLSRLIIDQSGQMQMLEMTESGDWILLWSEPSSIVDVYGYCGAYGILDPETLTCECLQGFEPISTKETGLNDWSIDCVRINPLNCQTIDAENDSNRYLKISGLALPNNTIYNFPNDELCRTACSLNCTCVAYASNGSECSLWEGELMNLKLTDESNNEQEFYLRVASFEQTAKGRRTMWLIIGIVTPLCAIIIGLILWLSYKRKMKQKGAKSSGEDLQLFDFEGNSDSNQKKDLELPFFSFASVSAATSGFSLDNKLGQGGFGPVYRGILLNGQEIAVKRLSKRSGQGVEEFRNESLLIAKLQHRNLVRLLGSCIDQDENILIYEYMPNKSLNFFLFDPNKREMLDWRSRIHIIEGISQGLLYLHQYSRLRIIHRDLKASNILLDNEMNPKISDFGMARMFGINELEANTERIVGTYGYMSPEYAMQGHFSIKSDVFSFGVLLLEIISGKRNTGFYRSNSLNLLTHAWDLWIADKGLELLDETVICPSPGLVLRYINIGLLCVQEHPDDRPTMSEVVSLLSNELVPLQLPKKPAFSTGRAVNLSLRNSENCSANGVTISGVEAR